MTTLIIGAGLAGLAAALELQERGEDFEIIEQKNRAGGVVGSVRKSGFLLERGPRTVAGNAPSLSRLIDAAGLRNECLSSRQEAQKRYVFSKGQLHPVPQGPSQLWQSKLISFAGKARILAEPLLPRGGTATESIEEFVTRRFGAEASLRLADPMCAGVFGGLPSRLGIDAFARAAELESQHGSVLVGMATSAKQRRETGQAVHTLLSFQEGLQQLTDALGTHFAKNLRLNTQVTSISPETNGFAVHIENLSTADTEAEIKHADRLVIAVPAPVAASLLEPLHRGVSESLRSIRQAPIAVVALGYEADSIRHSLDGFGLLCCSDSPVPEKSPILGVLFSSSVFEDRAPKGSVLLEVMIGGDRNPEALESNDDDLLEQAKGAIEGLLGGSAPPLFHDITRWAPVLPQYAPGHRTLIEDIEQHLQSLGPVALAGNYLRGVGVEGAASSGVMAVTNLLAGSQPTK